MVNESLMALRKEGKIKFQDTDFVYEISCDQMCGSGHYSMKGIIVVETQDEYNRWLAEKKPQYLTVKEAAAPAAPAADSTARPIAQAIN